jgi:hypothetical protein
MPPSLDHPHHLLPYIASRDVPLGVPGPTPQAPDWDPRTPGPARLRAPNVTPGWPARFLADRAEVRRTPSSKAQAWSEMWAGGSAAVCSSLRTNSKRRTAGHRHVPGGPWRAVALRGAVNHGRTESHCGVTLVVRVGLEPPSMRAGAFLTGRDGLQTPSCGQRGARGDGDVGAGRRCNVSTSSRPSHLRDV